MERFTRFVTLSGGALCKHGTVQVYLAGTSTPAIIYSDAQGTTLSNPFAIDQNTGEVEFFAQNGLYDIVITTPYGDPLLFPYVSLFDPTDHTVTASGLNVDLVNYRLATDPTKGWHGWWAADGIHFETTAGSGADIFFHPDGGTVHLNTSLDVSGNGEIHATGRINSNYDPIDGTPSLWLSSSRTPSTHKDYIFVNPEGQTFDHFLHFMKDGADTVTIDSDGLLSTNSIRLSDGSASAPSYGFASDPTKGLYLSAGVVRISGNMQTSGNIVAGGNVQLQNAAWFGYTDIFLYRDAANTLAQRNGTNAQTLRLYNTYTDASNYERLSFRWTGTGQTNWIIGPENAGTGSARSVGVQGGYQVQLLTGGVVRWLVDNNGHFIAGTDNTTDIGANGANRPRDIYVGGKVKANTLENNASSFTVSSIGDTYARTLQLSSGQLFGAYNGNMSMFSVSTGTRADLYLYAADAYHANSTEVGSDVYIRGGRTYGAAPAGSSIYLQTSDPTTDGSRGVWTTGLQITGAGKAIFGGQIQAQDGTASSPSYSFAGAPTHGMYRSADSFRFAVYGVPLAGIVWDGSTAYLDLYGSRLYAESSTTQALRNGTNAQTFRVYNTYTDSANYERGVFGWGAYTANTFYIGTEKAGTGQSRSVVLMRDGTANLAFDTNGVTFWRSFLAGTDNTLDIGASGANRPRNIFVAGTITTPVVAVTNYMTIAGTTNAQIQMNYASDTSFLYPYAQFTRSRGTIASPSSCLGGDYVGAFNFYGRTDAGSSMGVAGFSAVIDSINGANNYPLGRITFAVNDGTTGGSNFNVFDCTSARFNLFTHVKFNADNTFDIGASGANRPRYIYVAGGVFSGAKPTGMNDGDFSASRSSVTGAYYWGSDGSVWVYRDATKGLQIGGSGLQWASDNAYDIGQSNANRPKNVFVGSTVYSPAISVANSAVYLSASGISLNGDLKSRISGSPNGAVAFNYNTGGTLGLDFYGGGTTSLWGVDANGNVTQSGKLLLPGLTNSLGVGGNAGYYRLYFDNSTGHAGLGSNLYFDGTQWSYVATAGYAGQGASLEIFPGNDMILYHAANGVNPATPSAKWKVNLPTGDMTLFGQVKFYNDNSNDIGASGANRPRNIYVANTLDAGANVYVGGGATRLWTTGVGLGNGKVVTFTADANSALSIDTGLSRWGAGQVAAGNGTAGDGSGVFIANQFVHNGDGSRLNIAGLRMMSSGAVSWTSTAASSGTADTGLSRVNVGTVAVGNGTAGDASGAFMGKTLYFPDTSGMVRWWSGSAYDTNLSRAAANTLAIGNGAAGDSTGKLQVASVFSTGNYLTFGTNSSARWEIGVGGHLYPFGSGVYDIGISGTNAVRNIYATKLYGDGSALTGITGATGGISNTGTTTIAAGSDATTDKLVAFFNGGAQVAAYNTTQHLAQNGTVSAPSYSFTNSANTGFYSPGASAVRFTAGGADTSSFYNGGIAVAASGSIGWGSVGVTSVDTFLFRDASNTLAQRNGTNAQVFRIYNTYTDAANNDRLEFSKYNANTWQLSTTYVGTGQSQNLGFSNNGVLKWFFDFKTSNSLYAMTDNAYDIGASGANRPRTGYFGSHVYTGGNVFASGGVLSNDYRAASTAAFKWSPTTNYTDVPDASISRNAASTVQIGDGGVNANGSLVAANVQVNAALFLGSAGSYIRFYNGSTNDVSLGRQGAGVLQVGDGTSNNANGKVVASNLTNTVTKVSLTGQTASIGVTPLLSNAPAGLYRISAYWYTTVVGTAGTVGFGVTGGINGGYGGQTADLTKNNALGQNFSVWVFKVAANTTINYYTTVTGNVGAQYGVDVVLEQIA